MAKAAFEIGKKERNYIDALYAMRGVGSSIAERVTFLKNHLGYSEMSSCDGEVTAKMQLEALEIALIVDSDS